MKKLITTLMLLCGIIASAATDSFNLKSPDGKLSVDISTNQSITYTVSFDGKQVIAPSQASLKLVDGMEIGVNPRVSGVKRSSADTMIDSPFYRATQIRDNYNQLTFNVAKNWAIEFRAYNDGVAYRFVYSGKTPVTIKNETYKVNFPGSETFASVPYVRPRSKSTESFETQFFNSFENIYTTKPLKELDRTRLIFLPAVFEPADGVKVTLTETGLLNYPGLYINANGDNSLQGIFAAVPETVEQGGHNQLQLIVKSRHDYIAQIDGARSLPWRIAVVTDNDTDLASTNLTYLLAEPSRVADISWIKPGKVAWDWWNNWNIDGVDFKTGVNNDTYKAYIDFASENGIEYVILDEGWAVNKKADLMQVVPEIDLPMLVDYAKKKNVGIILWAGYYAFDRDMENVCRHYADMGVKGFKVDFMDRDDQTIIDFNSRAAETAARYNLILDLHGTSKPAGLNRTYPNVLNFEGVNGLEQMKWSPDTLDQVLYDVMIPFARQVAGPMDYTQGAMRNASKGNYHPCNSEPMSQGTRCRQLALYVIFDSPFNMLCDSPSAYRREPESTAFIAEIPTVWDETRVLDAKMGEYIITARRAGDTWYVGGITDRSPRDIEVDLSFIAKPQAEMTLFADGTNAHRIGRDYKKTVSTVDTTRPLKLHLAPGGGFAARIK
ncbi:MAG: glycoside hydrolase family 97 protein [Muribaculaceae bacterium]|nr:glycoside hydrolase family 97 protein [Muribaculaceae bacterium]MDE6644140.1 glycoside hydrolase family 97 protein [Muribaculaceae bacterium]